MYAVCLLCLLGVKSERIFYFYNLQPVNNSCRGDPLGPPAIYQDAAFPPEDKLYVTLLLNTSAQVILISGGTSLEHRFDRPAGRSTAPVHSFNAGAGLHSFSVPRHAGLQTIRVERNGTVLASVVGAEQVNASSDPALKTRCDHQTFTGSVAW